MSVPALGNVAYRLYSTLHTYANVMTGEMWPSLDPLALDLQVDRAHVRKAMKKLTDAGLVETVAGGRGGRRGRHGEGIPTRRRLTSPSADWIEGQEARRTGAKIALLDEGLQGQLSTFYRGEDGRCTRAKIAPQTLRNSQKNSHHQNGRSRGDDDVNRFADRWTDAEAQKRLPEARDFLASRDITDPNRTRLLKAMHDAVVEAWEGCDAAEVDAVVRQAAGQLDNGLVGDDPAAVFASLLRDEGPAKAREAADKERADREAKASEEQRKAEADHFTRRLAAEAFERVDGSEELQRALQSLRRRASRKKPPDIKRLASERVRTLGATSTPSISKEQIEALAVEQWHEAMPQRVKAARQELAMRRARRESAARQAAAEEAERQEKEKRQREVEAARRHCIDWFDGLPVELRRELSPRYAEPSADGHAGREQLRLLSVLDLYEQAKAGTLTVGGKKITLDKAQQLDEQKAEVGK
jgi:hypothetical protein